MYPGPQTSIVLSDNIIKAPIPYELKKYLFFLLYIAYLALMYSFSYCLFIEYQSQAKPIYLYCFYFVIAENDECLVTWNFSSFLRFQ